MVYLISKQGKKGKEISYSSLEMSEYLQPINEELTIEQKREMFAVRNSMIDIPNNFSRRDEQNRCICGETEEMIHIFNCEMLKQGETELTYQKIFTGNMSQQIQVYKIFKQNLEKREILRRKTNSTCDPDEIHCFSVMDNK